MTITLFEEDNFVCCKIYDLNFSELLRFDSWDGAMQHVARYLRDKSTRI